MPNDAHERDHDEMADQAENSAQDDEFDFEQWSKNNSLPRKLTALLRQQDLTTLETLVSLDKEDLASLPLTLGHHKMLAKAVSQIRTSMEPDTDRTTDSTGPRTSGPPQAGRSDETGVGGPVNNTQGPVNNTQGPVNNTQTAGRPSIGQVRQMAQQDHLAAAGKLLDDLLNAQEPALPQPAENPEKKFPPGLDPRTFLTVKATSTKVVHITQFLSEKTKKKRLRKKNSILMAKQDEMGRLMVATHDDHPYSGISMLEWSAANVRLLSHLLATGALAHQDIDFYLAYMTQIYELAEYNDWERILDLDFTYRERQAEHNFPWGCYVQQMQISLGSQP